MSQLRIKNIKDATFEVKRLYFESFCDMIQICPKCKHEENLSARHENLNYPKVNEPFKFHCYCPECDHEWEEDIMLDVKVLTLTK